MLKAQRVSCHFLLSHCSPQRLIDNHEPAPFTTLIMADIMAMWYGYYLAIQREYTMKGSLNNRCALTGHARIKISREDDESESGIWSREKQYAAQTKRTVLLESEGNSL